MSGFREARQAQLEALESRVRHCTRCKLHDTRQQAMPGEGPLDAPLFLVGIGPGKKEDETEEGRWMIDDKKL